MRTVAPPRLAQGVPLHDETWAGLLAATETVGVAAVRAEVMIA